MVAFRGPSCRTRDDDGISPSGSLHLLFAYQTRLQLQRTSPHLLQQPGSHLRIRRHGIRNYLAVPEMPRHDGGRRERSSREDAASLSRDFRGYTIRTDHFRVISWKQHPITINQHMMQELTYLSALLTLLTVWYAGTNSK